MLSNTGSPKEAPQPSKTVFVVFFSNTHKCKLSSNFNVGASCGFSRPSCNRYKVSKSYEHNFVIRDLPHNFMIFFSSRFKSPLSYSSVKNSLSVHQSICIQIYCDMRKDSKQVTTAICVENFKKSKHRFGIFLTGHVVRHVTESQALYTPV